MTVDKCHVLSIESNNNSQHHVNRQLIINKHMECIVPEMVENFGEPASHVSTESHIGNTTVWMAFKNKGNMEFIQQKYQEAIHHYSQAITELLQDTTSSTESMFSF